MSFEGDPFTPSTEDMRQIRQETISLGDGPIDLMLGSGQHAHHLRIVNPLRDLGPERRVLNTHIGCFIIDPSSFGRNTGFKAMRDGESVVLGRANRYDSHRFRFPNTVSREHVRLFRDENEIYITDLDSTNGTYVVETDHPETTPTQSDTETTDTTPRIETRIGERPRSYRLAGKTLPRYESSVNEDSYFIDEEHRTIAVFDGMGGHEGSEEASALAAEVVQKYLREIPASTPPALAEQAIREALENAHHAINEHSRKLNLPDDDPHMGTTAIVAKVFETETGTPYAMVGSAGDSRAYLLRSGQIEHVTLDHAFLGLPTGERRDIQDTLSQAIDLSKLSEREYAMFYNRAIIDSCLGAGPENPNPTITLTTFELQAGDQLLLTSDGVHDNLTNTEIEQTADQAGDNPEAIVNALVDAAKARSHDESHPRHKHDDTTAVVLSC